MIASGPPRIIVSLPGRDPDSVRDEIGWAHEDGADLAEVRFDRWAPASLPRAAELFPSRLPLVATYRSTAEGGHGDSEPTERARVLAGLFGLPFALVDLELARDLPLAPGLSEAVHRHRSIHLLTSAHLPSGTPVEAIHRLLVGSVAPDRVVKVVLPADVDELLERLLPGLPPSGIGAHLVLTTGRSGPLLRIWSRRRTLPFVFAAPTRSRGGPPVEPAQVPVDRLGPFLRATGEPPIFAVVGRSVGASRSPALHHRWMSRRERVGIYCALDLRDAREFVDVLPRLAEGGFRGLNVTAPFKIDALEAADDASAAAERAGCANTLTFTGGRILAENTDVAAMIRRLEELRRSREGGVSRVTILGSGGAARAALAAAATLGVRSEILARDPVAADGLAHRFGATVRASGEARPADLLVHATPAGTAADPDLALPLEGVIGPATYVLDYVYDAHHAALQERARQHGATYEDGLRLLVYQAAESFRIWWGEPPPPSEIAGLLAERP